VNERLVSLLVPPELPPAAPGRALAVSVLAAETTSPHGSPVGRLLLGTAVIDRSGRVRDGALLTALGWGAGERLTVGMAPGAAVLRRVADGAFRIDGRGQVFVPAAVRALLGIGSGERMVLVALLDADVLVMHPVAVVAGWLAGHYDDLPGTGDER